MGQWLYHMDGILGPLILYKFNYLEIVYSRQHRKVSEQENY